MYPADLHHMTGWIIRDMSAGNNTFALCSEDKCVTWGQAQYGELGYGVGGKKSSANPDVVPSLTGIHTYRVACGMGHTLFLVDAAKADKFETFTSTVTHAEEQAAADKKGESKMGKKRATGLASKGGVKKAGAKKK